VIDVEVDLFQERHGDLQGSRRPLRLAQIGLDKGPDPAFRVSQAITDADLRLGGYQPKGRVQQRQLAGHRPQLALSEFNPGDQPGTFGR
jgi:hypothetical protein